MRTKKWNKKDKYIQTLLIVILVCVSCVFLYSVLKLEHFSDVLLTLSLSKEECSGSFCVPSQNISVDLYTVDSSWNNSWKLAQKYTDAVNSAAFLLNYAPVPVISDHNYQAFENLSCISVGVEAYIQNNDAEKTHYRCIDVGTGVNNGFGLYDENNVFWNDWHGCDLITYTCMGENNDVDVVIVLWKEI